MSEKLLFFNSPYIYIYVCKLASSFFFLFRTLIYLCIFLIVQSKNWRSWIDLTISTRKQTHVNYQYGNSFACPQNVPKKHMMSHKYAKSKGKLRITLRLWTILHIYICTLFLSTTFLIFIL